MVTRPFAYSLENFEPHTKKIGYSAKSKQESCRQTRDAGLPPAGVQQARLNMKSWKKITLGQQWDNFEPNAMQHMDREYYADLEQSEGRSLSRRRNSYGQARICPAEMEKHAGSSSRTCLIMEQFRIPQQRPGDNWHGTIGKEQKSGQKGASRKDILPIDFIQKKGKGTFKQGEKTTDHIGHCQHPEQKSGTRSAYVKSQRGKRRIWDFDPNSKERNHEDKIGRKIDIPRVEDDTGVHGCMEMETLCENADTMREEYLKRQFKAKGAAGRGPGEANSSHKIWGLLDRRECIDPSRREHRKARVEDRKAGLQLEELDGKFKPVKRILAPPSGGDFSVANPPWAEYPESDPWGLSQRGSIGDASPEEGLGATETPAIQRSLSARFSRDMATGSARGSDAGRARTPPPRRSSDAGGSQRGISPRGISPRGSQSMREMTPAASEVMKSFRAGASTPPVVSLTPRRHSRRESEQLRLAKSQSQPLQSAR